MRPINPEALVQLIKKHTHYEFTDPKLLLEALTHPSSSGLNNQKLEFLGDSILNFGSALLIYQLRPDLSEGEMSKLRTLLINTDALASWASDMELSLDTSGHQSIGERSRADALEALLAAIYLDAARQGREGFALIMSLLEQRYGSLVRNATVALWEASDAKTTLQERAAKVDLGSPVYHLISKTGPDHAPVFLVHAVLGEWTAEGTSNTVKKAEAVAARLLLEQMKTVGL
ncbi:MAG: ribonuclease [Acidobacteriota bacterium]|jgi:ribonuclease-3